MTAWSYALPLLWSVLVFLVPPALARAQDPPAGIQSPAGQGTPSNASGLQAVPNRPSFSTTAESVQRGVFEIEFGLEAGKGHQNLNGLFKFGLTSHLELRFTNLPIERDAGIAGRGDSGVGVKFRILEQKGARPSLALLYNATLPTATAELGAGSIDHAAGLLLSKDFGAHHVDINGIAGWLGRPESAGFDRNYFTAVSYCHPLRGKFALTAEIASFTRTNAETPASLLLLQALSYSPSPRVVWDAGCYEAARGNFPRVTCFAGVTYAVVDLYRHFRHR
jgi:hypothetical protein